MKRCVFLTTGGVLLVALLYPSQTHGSEVILVTYAPAQVVAGDQQTENLAVGTPYINETPPDGTVIISDRLGIGTTAPDRQLHVAGTAGVSETLARFGIAPEALFISHSNPIISSNSFRSGAGPWQLDGTGAASALNMVGGQFIFSTAVSGAAGTTPAFVERMRITNDGKVGIGLTSGAPAESVDVAGNVKLSFVSGGGTRQIYVADGPGPSDRVDLLIRAVGSSGPNPSGNVTIQAGSRPISGTGGSVTMTGGDVPGGTAGRVDIRGGNSTVSGGSNTAGGVSFAGGDAAAGGSGTGAAALVRGGVGSTGGAVTIQGGNSNVSGGGTPGTAIVQGGTAGSGGSAQLLGGTSNIPGTGIRGSVIAYGASASTGGPVVIQAGGVSMPRR